MAERHWQSNDLCISKLVLQEGDFMKNPGGFGATITLEIEDHDIKEFYEKHPDDTFFITKRTVEDSKLVISIGMACTELDLSLEKVALSMFPGEKSRFDVSSKIQEEWITLHFVAIRQNTSEEPVYKWTNARKLSEAQTFYDFAVDLIKFKHYEGAFKMFKQAATLASFIMSSKDELYVEKSKELKLKCMSNLTLCHNYLKKYPEVLQSIDYMFENYEKDLQNKAKLQSRRGHAHIKLQNYEKAIEDLTEALEIEPENNNTINDLKLAKQLKKNHELKMGNALKKMFS